MWCLRAGGAGMSTAALARSHPPNAPGRRTLVAVGVPTITRVRCSAGVPCAISRRRLTRDASTLSFLPVVVRQRVRLAYTSAAKHGRDRRAAIGPCSRPVTRVFFTRRSRPPRSRARRDVRHEREAASIGARLWRLNVLVELGRRREVTAKSPLDPDASASRAPAPDRSGSPSASRARASPRDRPDPERTTRATLSRAARAASTITAESVGSVLDQAAAPGLGRADAGGRYCRRCLRERDVRERDVRLNVVECATVGGASTSLVVLGVIAARASSG